LASADEPNFVPRTYRVSHVTTYRYEGGEVSSCFERGMLELRNTPSQQVLESTIDISPEPSVISSHQDHFGNHSSYIEIHTPYTELRVTKIGTVRIAWPPVDIERLNQFTVDQAVRRVADMGPGDVEQLTAVESSTYVLPSRLVEFSDEVLAYARLHLPGDRPMGDALLGLTRGIFADFRYVKGVTSTKTTLSEVLALRAGVCQDFAHLAVGCLRMVGLPARYVSGYIETQPPPGKVKLAGSDASHAWVSVAVPLGSPDDRTDGVEWIDMDPTNDHFADSRYIVTAWGRDFSDVSPLRGLVFTEAESSTLDVAVDVIRQPGELAGG